MLKKFVSKIEKKYTTNGTNNRIWHIGMPTISTQEPK